MSNALKGKERNCIMSKTSIIVREEQYKNATKYIGNVAEKGTSNDESFKTGLFLRLAAMDESFKRAFDSFEEDLGTWATDAGFSNTIFDLFSDDCCISTLRDSGFGAA